MLWIVVLVLLVAVIGAGTLLESPAWLVVPLALLIAAGMLAMRRLRTR